MTMWRSVVLLVAVIGVSVNSLKILEEITKSGSEIFKQAQDGTKVRQCSCNEQDKCVGEIEGDILACAKSCFNKADKLTSQADRLKECFATRVYLAKNFLQCFISNTDGCVKDENGPMIPKVNIRELIRLGREKVHDHVVRVTKALSKPFDQLISVAAEISECTKECMVKKNKDGFCFDKKGCQAKLEPRKTQRTLRKCAKKMDWKKEAGALCECTVKAGIKELDQYCAMMRAASSG